MSSIETIKDRVSIVDVVSSYLKLEKAGGNFRAKCPFHNEKTPSFFVSPVRNSYYCFGCGKGGDIFNFTQEMEGLDFKGSLKVLADKAGVTLENFKKEDKSASDRLYSILNDTTSFFQRNLIKNTSAIKYLYARGLKPETLKEFRIGFALDSWNNLKDHLLSLGYANKEMQKVGLVIAGENGSHDRFRSRIMFPISDNAGRIVAFSGRIFDKEDGKVGKYVNSPETELFNKSQVLYGFDKAKQAIRTNKSVVLVEGQMDLLMAHQVGSKNTVAVSGTAFSEHHAKVLQRLSDKLILAFDADEAGLNATIKSSMVAVSNGMDVRAVDIPKGKDPADIILEDKNKWLSLVAQATHVITFFIKVLDSAHKDKREFRLAVGKKVLPIIKRMNNKIDQAHFMESTATSIGIDIASLQEELDKIPMIEFSEIAQGGVEDISKVKDDESRKQIIEKQIVSILLWQESLPKSAVDVCKYRKILYDMSGEEYVKNIFDIPEEEKAKNVFEIEFHFEKEHNIEEVLDELVLLLEKEKTKFNFQFAMDELRQAELDGNKELAEELLKKCQELSKKIGEF